MSILSKIKGRISTTKVKTRAIAAGIAMLLASTAAVVTVASVSASPVSTPDCDANAAVWCGVGQNGTGVSAQINQVKKVYANGDGHNKYYMIQDMYNYFGMSTSVINGMSTSNVTTGYVTSSGDVYATVNGQNTLVATGAITAGRQNISGSTSVKYGATTFFTRPTHVSFQNGELSAVVIMKNGVFQNAILTSCGNPVKATPKKPSYSIKKTVNGASSVTVKSGSSVNYQIQVASTGPVPVDNVVVRDTLPTSNLTVDKTTLRENGKTVSATEISQFFGTGYTIPSIKNGTTVTFTFTASKAGNADYAALNCAAETINNTAYISSTGLPNENSTATVKTTCETPELVCSSLTPASIGKPDQLTGDTEYTFTAKASATRTTIESYTFDFGDKSKTDVVTSSATSVNSAAHTYAPGAWTATVTVAGKDATGTPVTKSCTYTVKVGQPAPGTLSCTALTDTKGATDTTTGKTTYMFNTAATASANAKITGYTYSLDNGTPVAGGASTSYDLAPGSHTVKATVVGTDLTTNKAISNTSSKCVVTVTPPQLHPNYTIQKLVSSSANGTYVSNLANIPTGSTVYYKIVVKSTGDAPVQNVVVSDKADADVHYVSGTLQQDGVAVDATAFFGKGITLATINNGDTVTFTFSATVGNTSTDTDPSCKAETLNNTGSMTTTTPGLAGQSSSAKVTTTCTHLTGNLTCSLLTLLPGDTDSNGNQKYSFTGGATASNATIKSYSFVVTDTKVNKVVASLPGTLSSNGQSATTSSTTLAPGSYQVVLTVAGTDNYGKTVTAPANNNCAKNLTVPPVQQTYQYVCDLLTFDTNNTTRTVSNLNVKAHSTDTSATFSNVTIDWGEQGVAPTTVPAGQEGSLNHTYAAGVTSATVTATATFTLTNGTTKTAVSTDCTKTVSFTSTPECMPGVPMGSAACTCKYNSNLQANSPECVPPVLPNTGAGDVIGIFVGTVVAATIGFRFYTIHKLSRY